MLLEVPLGIMVSICNMALSQHGVVSQNVSKHDPKGSPVLGAIAHQKTRFLPDLRPRRIIFPLTVSNVFHGVMSNACWCFVVTVDLGWGLCVPHFCKDQSDYLCILAVHK